MSQEINEFQNLINKDKYQVFVFDSPAFIPINFARHPWFVLNKKGVLSRWEVRDTKDKETGSYLFINNQPLFQGINVFYFPKNVFWKAKLLGYIDGDEGSTAQRMINFIENSKAIYPYVYSYSLIGPNSNSYAEWILSKFPEFRVSLPWNSVGKNFKI